MATLFMDNAEIYGVTSALFDGMYADYNGNPALDKIEAKPCFAFYSLNIGKQALRKVLPGSYSTLFFAFRVRVSTLGASSNQTPVFWLRDFNNNAVASVYFDTTGRVVVSRGDMPGVELGRSASPVLVAQTWTHFEVKIGVDGTTGVFEVRTNDSSVPVISLTNVNTNGTGSPISQIQFGATNTNGIDTYFTDIHVWDTTGTRNNNFLGDVAIATLWPAADVETGWTPNYRKKIGNGILDNNKNNATAIYCSDSAQFEFGTGDYTLETFIRFRSLPTGTNRATIMGKWFEGGVRPNERSYELSKCGPSLNGGNLEFRISTGGTAGTVTTLISAPWNPETDRWYHVAVVRASGQTMLFVDGVMLGVPVSDSNNYYDGTAAFAVGGYVDDQGGLGVVPVSGRTIKGYFDETRVSRVARYTANFTPPSTAFGRNVGADPQFANVALLVGYDNGTIADESSFTRAIILTREAGVNKQSPSALTIDDGSFQFQTIDDQDSLAFGAPRDDTNISASLYAATAVLTLGSNPAVNSTVVVGNTDNRTYKFVTTPAAANDVKIGTNIADSLHNLALAINRGTGEGTLYGTGTLAHSEVYATEMPSPQMRVTALVAGTGGNSIAVSTTVGSSAWDNATLTGGQNIPGPSSFRLTRLPPGVTSVRSVMAVTRAYKTEAGPATMKTNFVGPAGTVAQGSDKSLTVDPTYRIDIFESDPDTSGPLTPSTLVSGRIQFNRTS